MNRQEKYKRNWHGRKLKPNGNAFKFDHIKKKVTGIFDNVLSQLDPYLRVKNLIQLNGNILQCGGEQIQFAEESRLIVVGAGKASHRMAKGIHEIFDDRALGIINCHRDLGNIPQLGNIHFQPAGHPNPDEGSIKGTEKILQLLKSVKSNDIVFSLISGGGSAMLELPVAEISLEDYITVNELLNYMGIDIEKWNTVRKHLSQVKGGKLAHISFGAKKIFNLMISDVPNDRPDIIASGPFAADPSTFVDAFNVLGDLKIKASRMGKEIPDKVLDYIYNNQGKLENETLKIEPDNVTHLTVASNDSAIDWVKEHLELVGIESSRIKCQRNISGDVWGNVKDIYIELEKMVHHNPKEPAAVIAGGEPTVNVSQYQGYQSGKSFGGRMQMMAAFMIQLIDQLPIVGLFAATDCRDGTSPIGKPHSAGALIDGNTFSNSQKKGVSIDPFIYACNTYDLHEKLSTQLIRKKFVTNVRDLIVLLYWPLY